MRTGRLQKKGNTSISRLYGYSTNLVQKNSKD